MAEGMRTPEQGVPRRRSNPYIALTAYPLSFEYRVQLEEALGAVPDYVTLTELRQLRVPRMLARLSRMKYERMLLPFEDPGSDSILPLLAVLASVSRASRIETVDATLAFQRVRRPRALIWLFEAGWLSIRGLFAAFMCRWQLDRLNSATRLSASAGKGAALYLKTNLSMGVTAGGSVGHIAGVVNEMVRKGLELVYVSADEPILLDPQVEHREVDRPTSFALPRDVNPYLFHRRFLRQALDIASSRPVRFIYQRLSLGNYLGVLLSRRIRAPLVLEYNGSEVWVAQNWGYPLSFPGLAAKAEEACLRHAHLVVTVSDALRDQLIERGVEPARIVTYPNCVDPQVFDPARFTTQQIDDVRARYEIPPDALVVTFLGTFGRWHGVDVLADAVLHLVDDHQDWMDERRVCFLLVGDGIRRPEIASVLTREPYSNYTRMPGLVPQAEAAIHLAASDIVVAPTVPNPDGSPFFGSPTKLFEYMAMGKAIVASDLDQIGQILRGSPRPDRLTYASTLPSGSAAILVEPGAGQELASAIRLLVERREWRAEIGRNARELALARYTWDRHVDAILRAPALRSSGRTTPSG